MAREYGRGLGSIEVERVADGVEVARGGWPYKTFNVYLLEDEGGLTLFDAGIEAMAKALELACRERGGIRRVVLGHAHADHRGTAPRLGAPVWCHTADRADAEGDGGMHYFDYRKLARFKLLGRRSARLWLRLWDGGPVRIEGTLEEGGEVAGFRVVHLPGHAPGQIGLWREEDRLLLSTDTFYLLDPQTGRPGPARVPHEAFNHDQEQARASVRKVAEMEPAIVGPGHLGPLTGDVAAQLQPALR